MFTVPITDEVYRLVHQCVPANVREGHHLPLTDYTALSSHVWRQLSRHADDHDYVRHTLAALRGVFTPVRLTLARAERYQLPPGIMHAASGHTIVAGTGALHQILCVAVVLYAKWRGRVRANPDDYRHMADLAALVTIPEIKLLLLSISDFPESH